MGNCWFRVAVPKSDLELFIKAPSLEVAVGRAVSDFVAEIGRSGESLADFGVSAEDFVGEMLRECGPGVFERHGRGGALVRLVELEEVVERALPGRRGPLLVYLCYDFAEEANEGFSRSERKLEIGGWYVESVDANISKTSDDIVEVDVCINHPQAVESSVGSFVVPAESTPDEAWSLLYPLVEELVIARNG